MVSQGARICESDDDAVASVGYSIDECESLLQGRGAVASVNAVTWPRNCYKRGLMIRARLEVHSMSFPKNTFIFKEKTILVILNILYKDVLNFISRGGVLRGFYDLQEVINTPTPTLQI